MMRCGMGVGFATIFTKPNSQKRVRVSHSVELITKKSISPFFVIEIAENVIQEFEFFFLF